MEREPLEGIGAADTHLGRTVPLPTLPLPLARWVDVVTCGPDAVQVEWNLDATRAGSPGRLALYAGHATPGERGLPAPTTVGRYAYRRAPLEEAQPELRPVHARVGARWAAPTAHGPGPVAPRRARRPRRLHRLTRGRRRPPQPLHCAR